MSAVCLCTSPNENTVSFTLDRIIPVSSKVAPLSCLELFDQHDTQYSAIRFSKK